MPFDGAVYRALTMIGLLYFPKDPFACEQHCSRAATPKLAKLQRNAKFNVVYMQQPLPGAPYRTLGEFKYPKELSNL